MSQCLKCGAEGMTFRCQQCGSKKDETLMETPVPTYAMALQDTSRSQDLPVAMSPGLPQSARRNGASTRIENLGSILHKTPEGTVTQEGVNRLVDTDEAMIWSGKPSPLFAAGLAIKWALGISVSILFAILIGGWFWVLFWMFAAIMRIGLYVLALSRMTYCITTQRVEVTDGLLHQQVRTYETHELRDATVDSPFPLGFLGLSILTIQHRDGSGPAFPLVRIFHSIPANTYPSCIALPGIPTEAAKVIRDVLRNTGQNEAQRLDKWRIR